MQTEDTLGERIASLKGVCTCHLQRIAKLCQSRGRKQPAKALTRNVCPSMFVSGTCRSNWRGRRPSLEMSGPSGTACCPVLLLPLLCQMRGATKV